LIIEVISVSEIDLYFYIFLKINNTKL